MKTLFKSDMGRIFKNPLFYIVSVLSLVLLFFVRNSVPDLEYQSKSFTSCFLLVGNFVIPILYYYLVFGDDLKYGVFAFDIGRGISRRELIISKAIEFAVLLSLFYGLSLGVIVLRLVYVGIPVTMGVRALFDRYRSKALTGKRVEGRIKRLQELNRFIRHEDAPEETEKLTEGTTGETLAVVGEVR